MRQSHPCLGSISALNSRTIVAAKIRRRLEETKRDEGYQDWREQKRATSHTRKGEGSRTVTRSQSVGKRTASERQKIDCFVAHFALTVTGLLVVCSSFSLFSLFLGGLRRVSCLI